MKMPTVYALLQLGLKPASSALCLTRHRYPVGNMRVKWQDSNLLKTYSSAATSTRTVDVMTQVEVLKHTDNRGSFYDESTMLAASLEALGHLRLPDIAAVKPVLKQLTRFLSRETVLPSHHAVVAQAGLRALVELALSSRPSAGFISR